MSDRRRTVESLLVDAIHAVLGHPVAGAGSSVRVMGDTGVLVRPLAMVESVQLEVARSRRGTGTRTAADALVVALFEEHGSSLVRMVRLFVDDRNAAEDLVQEAFIRLARSAHRIKDPAKAPAYLRSIVLNLARDHNRRGLVSLRHHLPADDLRASVEDEIVIAEDQQRVIDALRDLPHRQRDCLVLRYYDELGIDDIATTLGISPNSVKTHLKRGLRSLEASLAEAGIDVESPKVGES